MKRNSGAMAGAARGAATRDARRAMTVCAAAVAIAAGGIHQAAAAGQTRPAAVAQAQETVAFDIPAQPLSGALTAFGRQSGWQVSVDHGDLSGLDAPAVRGRLQPEEALRRLLSGTGVIWRRTDDRSVVLTKPGGQSGTETLPPITVEGRRQTATGPVDGYVASRSAAGTKTDTPLIETPRSVSVVTRDQMDTLKPRTIAEALNYTPGIMTSITGVQPTSSDTVIRGFQQFSRQTYQDGLQVNFSNYSNAIAKEPYSLERVELLRGPASILYGQISPGGIVNAVSKRPQEEAHREIRPEFGSFDRKQFAFDVGGPATENEDVLFRIVGVARDADTQVDFTKDNRLYLSAGLTWKPTTATDITFLAEQQTDDSNFLRSFPASGTLTSNPNGKIPSNRFLGEPDFSDEDLERTSVGYLVEHRNDETWTFRQNLRYSYDRGELLTLFPNGYEADQRTLKRLTSALDTLSHHVAVDNQAQAAFETGPVSHTALAGLDYRWTYYERMSGFGTGPSIDIFAPVYGSAVSHPGYSTRTEETYEQAGLYAQDQAKIYDKWVLQFGGRHDWADSEIDNLVNGTTTTKSDSAFTGQAGLVYLFDNGLAPYVSYAESFEPQTGTDASGNDFEPTTGTQYEVGLKYEPSGRNAAITVSAFQITQQNVTTTDPDNTTFKVQTGEVRSRGIEVEARASLDLGLDLVATYTYQDVEVTKSNDADLGKTPTRTPETMASLWGNYRFRTGDLRGLRIGAGVKYVGETFADTSNDTVVPEYATADASLAYAVGGWDFAITATNLFDKEYVAACANTTSFCFFGARRTVIGSATYRW